MKRLLACVSLVAVTTTAATAATTTVSKTAPQPAVKSTSAHKPAPVPVKVAPADEYFGKLKLSILGIRNTIKDVGANLDIDQSRWTGLVNKADFAEDAMHDWEHKYPRDTWLAKTVFSLERMYAKLDSDVGRKRSMAAMLWVQRDFPTSWYGKQAKREIAQHRVGHPVDTAAVPVASPTPGSAQIAVPAILTSPLPAVLASPLPASSPIFDTPGAAANVTANPPGAPGLPAASPVPVPSPGGAH